MGGDPLKDKITVEELVCLELARQWNEEDVSYPLDWKEIHQQEQQKNNDGEEHVETDGSDL